MRKVIIVDYPSNMPASLTNESGLNIPLGMHDWNAIRRFAIFSALGIVAACLIFWLYFKVLIPLFVGAFLAYFVSPWVDAFERKRINRGVAAAMIIFIVLGAVGFALVKMGPLFYDQLRDLIHKVPALIDTLVKSASRPPSADFAEALQPREALWKSQSKASPPNSKKV